MADILVMGSEDALRRLIALVARGAGHTVREAADCGQALKLFRSRCPALVITDIVTSAQSESDAMITLRRERPDMPFLAISGGGSAIRGLRPTETLAKPFTADELLAAVARVLAG